MEIFLGLVALGILLYLFVTVADLRSKQKELINQLFDLQTKFYDLEKHFSAKLTAETKPQEIVSTLKIVDEKVEEKIIPDIKPAETIIPPAIQNTSSNLEEVEQDEDNFDEWHSAAITASTEEQIPSPPKEIPSPVLEPIFVEPQETAWSKLEKQFIDNWTGILGTAIMVLGVGFLSIYTAIKLSEVYRFIILLTYAGALTGAYFWLRNKEKWLKLGLWLRSAGAALSLFACLGAGYIDGLKFIQSPVAALAVLDIGIGINLLLAFVGKQQIFASIHVAISLIALSIVPDATLTELLMGGIVSLFGIGLTFKNKWEYHLLASISLFFGFHLLWYYHHHTPLSAIENYMAIFIVASVSVSAMLVHYRKAYEEVKFDLLPFIVHIVNWSYFATGLIMHSTGNKWKTLILIFAAVASYFLSRRAKQKNIQWLYYSDAIISTIILFVALFTLNNWHIDNAVIATLMLFAALLIQFMMHYQNEKLLFRYINIVQQCIGIGALVVFGEIGFVNTWQTMLVNKVVLGLFAAAALLAYHIYSNQNKKEDFKDSIFNNHEIAISISGLMSGIFALQFLILCVSVPFIFLQASAFAILFLWLNKKIQTASSAINALLFLLASVIFFVFQNEDNQYTTAQQWLYATGVYIPLFISIAWSYVKKIDKHFKWIGVYSIVVFTVYLIYASVENHYAVSYCFIALAIAIIELAILLNRKFKTELIEKNVVWHLFNCGYVVLLLLNISFLPAYFSHNQFANRDFQLLTIALLTAFVEVLYFISLNRMKFISNIFSFNKNFHTFFFELIFGTLYFVVCKEIFLQYHPIILLGFCMLLIFIQHQKNLQQRLLPYLSILSTVSLIQFFYSTNELNLPISTNYLAWFACFGAIILFLVLAYFIHHKVSNTLLKSVSKLFFALSVSSVILLFVSEIWQAFYWIVFAFIALFLYHFGKLKELLLYALGYYFIAAFSVAFLSSQFITINTSLLSSPSLVSISVIALMLTLVFLFYRWLKEESVADDIYSIIQRIKNPLIIYPLTFSIAIFLFFSYEKSLLTLLWVMECFVLFGLSLLLGEKQFRLISLVALVACIVRLFFYDLSRTNTITKALVFLGVGVIMIAINALHNRFKERYK